MRLIDADALLQEFETENTKSDSNLWHITGIKAFIDNQETAYDADKVVEKIREYFKKQIDKEVDKLKVVDFSCEINKIIRAGGKE